MGVLWAFIAMISWGVGDFLIQRSARKFGDGIALFLITAFAAVALLPFILYELPAIAALDYRFWLLMGTSLVMLFAALFDFEALRLGKISVVEPVYALEVPLTAVLGSLFLSEWLTPVQGILIIALVVGIVLVSLRSLHLLRSFRLEKGVFFAFFSALGMGTANFLFGIGARQTSPLLINWFTSAMIALTMAAYLTHTHQWNTLRKDWQKHKQLIVGVSIVDGLAWVAYAFSTLTISIAIATAISESYIALAALLGLMWNREKLLAHQKTGLVLAVGAAVVLGALSQK